MILHGREGEKWTIAIKAWLQPATKQEYIPQDVARTAASAVTGAAVRAAATAVVHVAVHAMITAAAA